MANIPKPIRKKAKENVMKSNKGSESHFGKKENFGEVSKEALKIRHKAIGKKALTQAGHKAAEMQLAHQKKHK